MECAVCEKELDLGNTCQVCDHDVCMDCVVELDGEGTFCKACIKTSAPVATATEGPIKTIYPDRTQFECEGQYFKVDEKDYPHWSHPEAGWIPINRKMSVFEKFVKGLIQHFRQTARGLDIVLGKPVEPEKTQDGKQELVKYTKPLWCRHCKKTSVPSIINNRSRNVSQLFCGECDKLIYEDALVYQEDEPKPPITNFHNRIPIIDENKCIGFNKCAKGYNSDSELFSGLHLCLYTCLSQPLDVQRPITLDPMGKTVIRSGCKQGCNHCVEACPHDAIRVGA